MPTNEPLKPASLLLRLALIGVILAAILSLFAYAGGWLTPGRLSPTTMIDTFEKVNGEHPGFRRNHAKGVCVSGWFDSNGSGAELSRAKVFAPGRIPILGRFALAGGMPYVADNPGIVRSIAVLFQLPDGEEWRTATIDLPVFPVRTPEAFREFLLATAPVAATGKPDPAKMQTFLAAHPETAKVLPSIGGRAISSAFANDTFNSLNAFRFVNANGKSVPVRWSLVPLQPFVASSATDPRLSDKNYLFDALIADIHAKPLQWKLIVTVGEPGDDESDATVVWPASRRQVEVGTLTFDRIESDDTSRVRDLTFDPLVLPDGITASSDPLLSARSASYLQSFRRREGEPKEPAAVSPAETAK